MVLAGLVGASLDPGLKSGLRPGLGLEDGRGAVALEPAQVGCSRVVFQGVG